jgi:hypothetical protein
MDVTEKTNIAQKRRATFPHNQQTFPQPIEKTLAESGFFCGKLGVFAL